MRKDGHGGRERERVTEVDMGEVEIKKECTIGKRKGMREMELYMQNKNTHKGGEGKFKVKKQNAE